MAKITGLNKVTGFGKIKGITGSNYSDLIGLSESIVVSLGGIQIIREDIKTGAGNALPVHSLKNIPAGALILITTAIDFGGGTVIMTPASLGWTKRCDTNSTELHTAIFTAGGNIDIQTTWNDAGTASSVCYVITGQESILGGNALSIQESDPPGFADPASGSITTTRDKSIIFGIVSDRNGIAGAVAYLNTPVQTFENRPASFSSWHFYKLNATAGAITQGLTAPSGGASQSMSLYEIRIP